MWSVIHKFCLFIGFCFLLSFHLLEIADSSNISRRKYELKSLIPFLFIKLSDFSSFWHSWPAWIFWFLQVDFFLLSLAKFLRFRVVFWCTRRHYFLLRSKYVISSTWPREKGACVTCARRTRCPSRGRWGRCVKSGSFTRTRRSPSVCRTKRVSGHCSGRIWLTSVSRIC
jgi:hypothetical protein